MEEGRFKGLSLAATKRFRYIRLTPQYMTRQGTLTNAMQSSYSPILRKGTTVSLLRVELLRLIVCQSWASSPAATGLKYEFRRHQVRQDASVYQRKYCSIETYVN